MLTPAFTVSQDEDFVTVMLRCPYVRAQEVEFYIEGTEFKFYVRPYFLRLNLPAPLIEDGRESASYDIDKGEITVKLPKETKGQHFADLDLLTKLMESKGQAASVGGTAAATGPATDGTPTIKPLIEVIGGSADAAMESESAPGESVDSDDEDEEFDWEFPQEAPKLALSTGAQYGFNNAYSGHGSHLSQIARDIVEIDDLDTSTPSSRREERLTKEELKFDDDHYVADFINDEEIQRLIKFRPESWAALKRIQKAKSSGSASAMVVDNGAPTPADSTSVANTLPDMDSLTISPSPSNAEPKALEPWLEFTPQEQEQMRSLRNKQYLLDDERSIYLGLVDLLFAYCYNHRTTEGENTVESCWTICKLSAILSCFETSTSLPQTLQTSIRRSLTYPLYRSFALSKRIIEDVAVLFKLGKRAILKALLEVREILATDEVGSVMRGLWVDDYCVWVQGCSEKRVKSLASELNHVVVEKADVGFPLEELEELAREVGNEEDEDEEGQGVEDRVMVDRGDL
ncbi:Hsp90 cochaperone shq1 [Rhizophlyctis rosea]|nr:Hsp90 cochaperone shq1 [Rhizophlyctis rosea]